MSDQEPWERQQTEWGGWAGGHGWRPGHGPPPWVRAMGREQRRAFLLRFLVILATLFLIIVGAMAILAYHLTQIFGENGLTVRLVWASGCALVLLLPLLALVLGARAMRRVAIPLADLMEAADEVAAGNLTVRVAERGSREFQRLAHSFNRMTEELARIDQQRRNLTADVAHELRTPLHVIQGNLEGILDGVYQPSREHIEATLEETRTLARLVDDLRTLSLAESGQLRLVREPVDAAELLADVATSFSGQAEAAGVELRVVEPAQPSPLLIDGDAGRLDQVLSNLVANAIRYTPRGGSVMLGAVAQDSHVRITVSDTGEGIAPEDLPFIFDRFWRADRARSHSSGAGSGLGLSIANKLVSAHGGEINVASTPGKGTTFTVDLPGPPRYTKIGPAAPEAR
ncbi:MAG: two-component sensor histidine kinase [Chloroflexi bacterium]|nr:MAG: two-component sensor histidine kinase [Chloroflexota bacterium]